MAEPKCGPMIGKMHPIGQMGFVGLVNYALATNEMREAFESDTGHKIPTPPKSPIEAMIDGATGHDKAWAAPFIDWCWDTLWGGEGAHQ